MFERYNINDLFLASIYVTFPEHTWDPTASGIVMMGPKGYKYLTILKKEGDRYIDLQYKSRRITTTRDPQTTSYMLENIQPLSKCYTQDGKRKQTFSKRAALLEMKKHYLAIYQEWFSQTEEVQKSSTI